MESIKKYNIYGVNRKYESDYGRNIDHRTITPEQALKDLREDAERHSFEQRQHLNKRLDIIETALKRLKKIETTTHSVLREDISKKLKALEIIKEKELNVFIFFFLHSGDLETYNDMAEDNRKLTQEEFNLLKEVLL